MSILNDSTHPPIFSVRRSLVYAIGRLGSTLVEWAQRWSADQEFRLSVQRDRAIRHHELRRELAEADYQRAMILPHLRASHLR
jgi:hypothetical protein